MLLLIGVTALTFWGLLDNGFTNWDDNIYVTDNPLIHSFSWENLKEILSTFYKNDYRFITVLLSFMAEYHFSALDPFLYHLDNLIIHILNTLLVFCLLWKLTGRLTASLVASLFFGVHPLQVETVAWVSERKGLLSGFFYLQSVILYLLYREKSDADGGGKGLYSLSIVTFLLALLSKLTSVTLPAVLLLCDYLRGRPITMKSLKDKLPFFFLSGVFAVDTLYMYKDMNQLGSLIPLSATQNMLVTVRNLITYISKTLLPVNLSVVYPHSEEVALSMPEFFIPLIVIIIIAVIVILTMKRTRLLVFSFLFFIVTLSPVIKIIPFASGGSTIADRYMYLPSIGLFLVAGTVFHYFYLWCGEGEGKARRAAAVVILAVLILSSSVLSMRRAEVWAGSVSLWKSVTETNPSYPKGYMSLANSYSEEGLLEEAIINHKKALSIDPGLADAHLNLANTYYKLDRLEEAIEEYHAAATLKPGDGKVRYYLARTYSEVGLIDNAAAEYAVASRLRPDDGDTHYNYGNVLAKLGRYDDALEEYQLAVSILEPWADLYNNMGIAYAGLGDIRAAAASFERALEIDPSSTEAGKNLREAKRVLEGSASD